MWLALIFIFYLALRLAPYIGNNVPLGYDPGIYLYIFKKFSEVSLLKYTSLPNWIVGSEPGIAIFVRLVTFGKIPLIEKGLIPLIILSSIFLFFSVWLLAKKIWDRKTALWTVFFLSISAVQYRAYWYYYLKNIAALSFLSLTIYFLLSTSYFAIPFAILIFYLHRPTSIFLIVILLTGLIFEKRKRKFYFIVTLVSLITAVPYYLSTFKLTVLPLLKPILTINSSGGSGTFYNLLPALGLSLIYLPFALWGILKQGKEKKILLAPLILSLIVVIFKLFFNRRVIIFADFFLLLFAGWAANQFFSSQTKLRRLLKFSYLALCVIFIGVFVEKTAKPLIFPDEFSEIKLLNETEPDAYVLVTDQAYTPWAYGWSERRVIAPGFGENDIYWTNNEWQEFWLSNNRETEKNLLLKLPKPLYIYDGDKKPLITPDFSTECFERINFRTYKFICTK
jgi:hypothetical protein